MADDIYRYLNFDQIAEFQKSAEEGSGLPQCEIRPGSRLIVRWRLINPALAGFFLSGRKAHSVLSGAMAPIARLPGIAAKAALSAPGVNAATAPLSWRSYWVVETLSRPVGDLPE